MNLLADKVYCGACEREYAILRLSFFHKIMGPAPKFCVYCAIPLVARPDLEGKAEKKP